MKTAAKIAEVLNAVFLERDPGDELLMDHCTYFAQST